MEALLLFVEKWKNWLLPLLYSDYIYSLFATMNKTYYFLLLYIMIFNACSSGNDSSHQNNTTDTLNGDIPFDSLLFDYERSDRVIWQKPGLIMDLMGDISQKTIADLGAGSGYFAFRLLPDAKKVLALDIDPRAIAFMDSIAAELPLEFQDKFETRLVEESNPNLEPGEADIILLVNTYMYISDRVNYFSRLKNALKNGSYLLIIDFKKKELSMGPPADIKLDQAQVEQELIQAGYKIDISDDRTLEYQYIITARKP
jgi:SAM-dependent methyltransferase